MNSSSWKTSSDQKPPNSKTSLENSREWEPRESTQESSSWSSWPWRSSANRTAWKSRIWCSESRASKTYSGHSEQPLRSRSKWKGTTTKNGSRLPTWPTRWTNSSIRLSTCTRKCQKLHRKTFSSKAQPDCSTSKSRITKKCPSPWSCTFLINP